MQVLAIFGPTAVGKTGVAIAVAERLRERGEDPVAVNCDSIQVYRGLEVLSAAPTWRSKGSSEHRLLSFVDPAEEFSAGRYAELAHAEIDGLLAEGRRPDRGRRHRPLPAAALADLDLRPPVPRRSARRSSSELAERGPEALHAELDPDLVGGGRSERPQADRPAHRAERAGIEPPAAPRACGPPSFATRRCWSGWRWTAASSASGSTPGWTRWSPRRRPTRQAERRLRAPRGRPGPRSASMSSWWVIVADEARAPPLRAPPAHLDAADGGRHLVIDRSGRDDAEVAERDPRAAGSGPR